MQDWAYKFYNSTAWKKCREAYKAVVHYQCEKCGGVGEIVHHKEPLTPENINDPHITLSFRNLRLECRKCHGVSHGNAITMNGVGFDDDGNLIEIPPPKIFERRGAAPQGIPPKNTQGARVTPPP